MASTAFISYSREDRQQAEKLRAVLEDAGIAVTIDRKDMGAGDEIAVFIEDSIRSTDATVSLVSRNSLRSQWVARETLRAFEAGRFASKKYLPCSLDTDFFDPEFVTNEVSRINEQLDKLNDERKRRQNLKVSSADIDDDIKRLMDLRNGLPDIVHRLKDDLTVDLTHGAFDDGVARLAFLERFDARELDALRQWKITTDEGVVAAAYLDPAQLSFSDVAPEPDFIYSLPQLAALDDLAERRAAWETDRNVLAIKEARLVGQGWWGRDRPYFIIEAGEGLWAAVLYEPRQTSEWHWALDRLEGDQVVARGVPGPADDPEDRAFDTLRASRPGQLVLILDGYAISSPDGETLINLTGRYP